MIYKLHRAGQSTIEYMMVLAFIAMISFAMVKKVGEFMGDQVGSLAHVLSIHLSVGVCKDSCFYSQYVNGKEY